MQYRYRVQHVEAMYMDGTPEGADAVIEWMRAIAPEIVVRQRVEYRGWGDRVGHVELEIQDVEEQCGATDWIVAEQHADQVMAIRVLDERTFHHRFQLRVD